MMSNFNTALPLILKHEGGLVNDPNDPGGITKFGISLRYLKSLTDQHPDLKAKFCLDGTNSLDAYDIEQLTLEKASDIYKHFWWEQYGYAKIQDLKLATKIFDMAVNIGPHKVKEILQQALTAIYPDIAKSQKNKGPFELVNILSPSEVAKLYQNFCDLIASYYQSLVAKNPLNQKYINGWLHRVYDYE